MNDNALYLLVTLGFFFILMTSPKEADWERIFKGVWFGVVALIILGVSGGC